MGTGEKKSNAKQIAAKYKVEELNQLSKEDLIQRCLSLSKQVSELEAELDVMVNTKMNAIAETKSRKKYSEYNPNWKGIEKVIYVLKENKLALKSDQILNELICLEPNQKLEWRSPYSAVMKYITRAVKAGRIAKIRVQTVGFVYALPEWVSSEGDLLTPYLRSI